MLNVYTPETAGGIIIFEWPTGKYHREEIHHGNSLVTVTEDRDGGIIVIEYEKSKIIKIISNQVLEFKKHETNDKYVVRSLTNEAP